MSHNAENATPFAPPFDGTRRPEDIRSFFVSEVEYLKSMRRRFACQFCGTSAGRCAGCARADERIEALGG